MPPTDPFDLHSAFANRTGNDWSIEVRTIGQLAHDGRIVARDPFTGQDNAFARVFPPGVHTVEALLLREHNDERIALARVVFSSAVPVTFELATRGDEDVRALAPGQRFGYGVDAGAGCFAVPGAVEAIDADALLAQFETHRRITWGWGVARPRHDGHEVVAFSSGYGDGIYASYVGLAADHTPVCLVTDFTCLPLIVPEIPDLPSFRRAHATAVYERMMAAVPGLGGAAHGDAYTAAAELVASPADAVHLVRKVVTHLRAARSELHQDLDRYVLGRLAAAAEVQRVLAPELSSLDDTTRTRLTEPDAQVADWIAAVRALWADAGLELRANILERERAWARSSMASRDPALRAPTLLAHALEAIATSDDALVQAGLDVLVDEVAHAGGSLPDITVQRVRRVATTTTSARVRTRAMYLMTKLGHDLAHELAAADPATRLAAASALGRDRASAHRSDPVLIALAHDAAVELALRFEATAQIRDRAAQIAAFLAVGLAGHEAAPIQLRYLGGPDAIAALQQLATTATDATVRQQAATYVVIAREIEDTKHREPPDDADDPDITDELES